MKNLFFIVIDKIRLLIVDDHRIVRSGIKLLFQGNEDVEFVGEFDNGTDALEIMSELQPNVVITDISMPKMNGFELTKKIKELHPSINVLVLSMHDDDDYILDALESGAMGYLLKDSDDEDIINAVNSIAAGKMYYNNSVSDVFAKKLLRQKTGDVEVKKLTDRELEVMELIVKGFNNKEIANLLFVSKRTIDNHRTNFMKKIGSKNTADIVRTAISMGLVKV